MALDLSRRTFLSAAASSAAMALTANNSASHAAEAMEDAAIIPGLLPDKPHHKTQPALLKAWNTMFQGTKQWVTPDLDNLNRIHPRKRPPIFGSSYPFAAVQPDAHQFIAPATSRHEDSSAWCGASIVAEAGKQFVQIYGKFAVPKASNPPDDELNKHYSSTWIGLDGARRYLNSTLPQVGVQQNTPGWNMPPLPEDLPDYYAWFQWWAPRRVKAELWWIKGVPVQPGDDVMGLIWAIDPDHVVVYFRNFRTNLITTFLMAAPEARHHTNTYNPIVSGATAEWMVEDPSEYVEASADDEPPKLEKLAVYTPVKFENCVAGMAATPGQATSEKVLTAPRYKRMYQVARNPLRTRLVSIAKRGASDTELVVSYGGFEG